MLEIMGKRPLFMIKSFIKTGSLILLSIVLLWWAVREIPIPEIFATLLRLSPIALLGLALLNVLILLLFTGRWWIVMRALGYRLPFLSLTFYRLAGFGISYFTPGPQVGGEPLQIHLLHRRHRVTGASAVAGVSLDKLIELLANLSFLIFGLILVFRGQLLSSSRLLLLLSTGLLTLPIIYISLLRLSSRPVAWFLMQLNFLGQLWPAFERARHQVISVEEQVSALVRHKPKALIGALLLSFATWILMIFEYWLTIRILGVYMQPGQVIAALTAARLAFLLPVPAGLGVLEAGQVAAMHLLGFDPVVGISASLLIRARDITLGAVGLWFGGFLTRLTPQEPAAVIKTVPVPSERRN
jgi:glycosyltransferase 2 family protein